MYTISVSASHLLVEFSGEFDRRVLAELMRHEAFFDDGPAKSTIWLIGKHTARLSMGEIPSVVDDAAQLPLERVKDKKTAIVTDRRSTRITMQMLADGLQHRLPLRCRTFKTIEEAHRWLDYVDSQTALPSSEPSIS
jgi:hypothetical protein